MKLKTLTLSLLLGLATSTFAEDRYLVRVPANVNLSAPEAPAPPAEPISLSLSDLALPAGMVGTPYSFNLLDRLTITGGTGSHNYSDTTWSLKAGDVLPPGLSLSGSLISGTPTVKNEAGTSFALTASYREVAAEQTYSLSVGAKKTYAVFPGSGTDKVTLGGGPYYLTEESSFTMPKPPSGVEKKYYFEIVMTKGDGLIGITTVNSSGQSNYYAGLDTEESRFFSYVNLAEFWSMGAGYNPGVAYRLGDTVSVLITQKYNETKAEFWSNCLKVGEISRSPYSVRPAVQIRYEAEVIANFGNRPFVCNVPDGYQPGLWSEQ